MTKFQKITMKKPIDDNYCQMLEPRTMEKNRTSHKCCHIMVFLGILVVAICIAVVVFNTHKISCLQRSMDELRLEMEDLQTTLYKKAQREEVAEMLAVKLDTLRTSNGDFEEEEEEEEEEEVNEGEEDTGLDQDEGDDDGSIRFFVGESLSRQKRDANDTVVPSTQKPRRNKDRQQKNKHKRGKKGRRGKSSTEVKAMHLESYVTDDQWKQVASGGKSEISYVHGKLTQKGFTPRSHTYQFWQVADWCKHGVRFAHYEDVSGHLRINQEGLYYVYSQVMYHDLTGTYAYGIFVNEKVMFQCMVTRRVDSSEKQLGDRHVVYEQCFTGGVLKLKRGDHLSIRNLHRSMFPKILLNLDHSAYWGLFKLD